MKKVFKKLLPYISTDAGQLRTGEKLRSGFAAFAGIFLVGWISSFFITGAGLPLIVASMGASAVLLFAASHSPLAQPWPLVGGNIISSLVGVTVAKFMPDPVLGAAVAVSLSVLIMLLTHSLHPPGGGVALVPFQGDPSLHALGYHFVLLPVGLNVLILLAAGVLINNLLPARRYPARPKSPDLLHKINDPKALDRVGLTQEDLHSALKDFNAYLDVSEADLGQVVRLAEMHAYRRKRGDITCGDIMSRDLVTAEFGTELEEVWAQMRLHKIKLIPVIDRAQRVIGVISLVDFLKRANLKTYETFQDKLVKFIKNTPGIASEKPEVVGQIMATPAFTARDDMHIVELVPLLSEKGLHHIPIVNAEQRLVGMVSQSDLIAALYAGEVTKA